jgi:hypothetical protein
MVKLRPDEIDVTNMLRNLLPIGGLLAILPIFKSSLLQHQQPTLVAFDQRLRKRSLSRDLTREPSGVGLQDATQVCLVEHDHVSRHLHRIDPMNRSNVREKLVSAGRRSEK